MPELYAILTVNCSKFNKFIRLKPRINQILYKSYQKGKRFSPVPKPNPSDNISCNKTLIRFRL